MNITDLPGLCLELIADELVDEDGTPADADADEVRAKIGDMCRRERSIEDMFVDMCAVSAVSKSLRSALGARLVTRLHRAVVKDISATKSVKAIRQYSNHPSRRAAKKEAWSDEWDVVCDNDRRKAVEYLFAKNTPKIKCLAGVSRRLRDIVKARPYATLTQPSTAYRIAASYGIDRDSLEAAMPSLVSEDVLSEGGTFELCVRRRDVRTAMVRVLGTPDLEGRRTAFAASRQRIAASLASIDGFVAADALLINLFVSVKASIDDVRNDLNRNVMSNKKYAPIDTAPGYDRMSMYWNNSDSKACPVCVIPYKSKHERRPCLSGRWTQTCRSCAPWCVDGEGASIVRYWGSKIEAAERASSYRHASIQVCGACFVAENKFARRRKDVRASCGCVFQPEGVDIAPYSW